MKQIDQLIINSPYIEPKEHWFYEREVREFVRKPGRRRAGFIVANPKAKNFDDPGNFVELPLVNTIRAQVKAWKTEGRPGLTGITKKLLTHWEDASQRDFPFFFCQLEAIETLIFLTEAPAAYKTGINMPSDGGDFIRWCSKMATGSGKTVIMSMIIAWNILNKATNRQDTRFSKNILIVAPGLTVRSRLAVLLPEDDGNYYDFFNIVPPALREKLRQGTLKIINWHKLSWESDEKIQKKKGVDKRGALSDAAYVRQVLGNEFAKAKNILVLNDEAHHAWRTAAESKVKKKTAAEVDNTIWVGGLDRIHQKIGILRCHDLSATPFAPTGKKSNEQGLFKWIVSDFGLNDAIESGLVKTPRVVVRDDGRRGGDYRSRLYHIYMDRDVKPDLNQKQDNIPLPDLVK
ncbi:MAG: DEAD/DEAH box helicase family protein, partial [Bacteroidota bacterium]